MQTILVRFLEWNVIDSIGVTFTGSCFFDLCPSILSFQRTSNLFEAAHGSHTEFARVKLSFNLSIQLYRGKHFLLQSSANRLLYLITVVDNSFLFCSKEPPE